MTTSGGASVSTHILDTSAGRPAAGVAVRLSARGPGTSGAWEPLGGSRTDEDGRCRDLPVPPPGTTHVRLEFAVEPYLTTAAAGRREDAAAFFPEVTVAFALRPGEHHHVPLLLSPFGYSVYRGS